MSDYTSAKYLNKQMKAKGLQKLRFYCQVCLKQCRDENGFRSHIKSQTHLDKISGVTEDDIDKYTNTFESDFLKSLRINHGEKAIPANKFYNEFIQDKDHIHMNATRFSSLSKFIQHLSSEGKIKVHNLEEFQDADEIEMGHLKISYVDNSSANSQTKLQLEELKENEKSAQDIKNYLLQKQIEAGLKVSTRLPAEETKPITTLQEGETISITLSTSNNKLGKIQKKPNKKKKKNVFK